MRLDQNIHLDYADVLLKPKRSTLSSRKNVELTRTFTFRNSKESYTCCPIVASNMDGVGTFSMAKILQEHKIMTVITKSTTLDQWKKAVGDGIKLKYLSVCTGAKKNTDDNDTMHNVLKNYPDVKFITIDVANGYHEHFVDFVKEMREDYPEKTIIAGNVVTAEMTEQLILSGADIVKVGIGPGSVCTTRIMTGVGVPQFSAVMECSDAANGVGGHIMADGGCTEPGDVAKAFGGGAHFVMLGGMLAGHNESELPIVDGQREFYGSSSDRAREKHGKSKAGYRGNEGRAITIPDRGPVKNTIEDLLGGVRSTCTYIGATRLKDVPKCSHFVRVNNVVNKVYESYENH